MYSPSLGRCISAKVPATFVPFGCGTALLSTFCVIASRINLLELDRTRVDPPLKEMSMRNADLVTWPDPVAARPGFGRSAPIYFFCN